MTEVITAMPERPAFKDRSTSLLLFGVIHVLFGLVCAGFILIFAVLAEIGTRRGGPALPTSVFATNVVTYGLLTVYFFSVGIGSIRKRRWARALVLMVSWMWLLTGLLSTVVLGVLAPRLLRTMPQDSANVIGAVIFGTILLLYVVIPGVILLAYRGPNVKATVEHYDRKIRWTDRAPLPVLAVAVLMGVSALSLLASTAYATIPFAGFIVTGVPAMIITLALASLLGFIALGLYRLKLSAWITLLLLQVLGAGVGALTILRTDFEELYTKMGIMRPDMRTLGILDLYRDPAILITMGVAWLLFFAFVLSLRRYFVGEGPRTRAADRSLTTG